MEYINWAKQQSNHIPFCVVNRDTFKKRFGDEAELRTVLHLVQHGRPYSYIVGMGGKFDSAFRERIELVIQDPHELETNSIFKDALVARGYTAESYSFDVASDGCVTDAAGAKFDVAGDLWDARFPWTLKVSVSITKKGSREVGRSHRRHQKQG